MLRLEITHHAICRVETPLRWGENRINLTCVGCCCVWSRIIYEVVEVSVDWDQLKDVVVRSTRVPKVAQGRISSPQCGRVSTSSVA